MSSTKAIVRSARVWLLQRAFVARPCLYTLSTDVQCERTASTLSFRPVLPLTTLHLATTRQSSRCPVAGSALPSCKLNPLRAFYNGSYRLSGHWFGPAAPSVLQDLNNLVVIQRRHKKTFKRGRRREAVRSHLVVFIFHIFYIQHILARVYICVCIKRNLHVIPHILHNYNCIKRRVGYKCIDICRVKYTDVRVCCQIGYMLSNRK